MNPGQSPGSFTWHRTCNLADLIPGGRIQLQVRDSKTNRGGVEVQSLRRRSKVVRGPPNGEEVNVIQNWQPVPFKVLAERGQLWVLWWEKWNRSDRIKSSAGGRISCEMDSGFC